MSWSIVKGQGNCLEVTHIQKGFHGFLNRPTEWLTHLLSNLGKATLCKTFSSSFLLQLWSKTHLCTNKKLGADILQWLALVPTL